MVIKKLGFHQKDKVNFKIYDLSAWLTNNCNTHLSYNTHIYSNTHKISQRKTNQAMKFGQLKEYNKRIFFFKNHAENESVGLVLDLFLFLKKKLHKRSKEVVYSLVSIYLDSHQLAIQFNCIKLLNFDFLEYGRDIVSPPHFVHYFLRKIFLRLCSFVMFLCYVNYCQI